MLSLETQQTQLLLSNGAVVIDGGVGIAKSIYIGGDIIGAGTFDGQTDISGITSVTATSYFGDGAGLINTGSTTISSIWYTKSCSYQFNIWNYDIHSDRW